MWMATVVRLNFAFDEYPKKEVTRTGIFKVLHQDTLRRLFISKNKKIQ